MAYEDLRKLYYKNRELYNETYQQRLNDAKTVKLDFEIHEKPAFFVPAIEVFEQIIAVERIDKEVQRLSARLPGVAKEQYAKKCLIDEIVLTNKIEGVHSSRQEIETVLDTLENQSKKAGKRDRFLGLVQKYQKLITGETVILETCQDIRDIYDELVLQEVLAEEPKNMPDGKIFRKEITNVCTATEKVIHQGVMPEAYIHELMEKALQLLQNEQIDYLCRICIFHYMIGYIHPFYDGNGRLARFIFSYGIAEHLEPLLAYRMSETIKENIKEYYAAFEICNDRHNLGDVTPFLLMMLNMILQALSDLKDSLTRKLYSWKEYETLIPELTADAISQKQYVSLCNLYSILIQASLFSENGITMKELMQTMGSSQNTIKSLLEYVAAHGHLQKQKNGKTYYYQIDLNALDDILLQM